MSRATWSSASTGPKRRPLRSRSTSIRPGVPAGGLILIILLLTLSLGVLATSYTDTFSPEPFTGVSTGFTTGTASTGMGYSIGGGDGGDFACASSGGDGGSATIDILSTSVGLATEKVTIESRDGKAFVFNSLWADIMGDGWTIKGLGPEPFTIHAGTGSSGTESPTGGAKLVTSIEITSSDFYNDYLDTVSVELDVPGPAVYGSGSLITNGDSSPNATDGTDMGATSIGAPITRTFTIENIGDAALSITGSVAVTGTGFSITEQPSSSVPVGGSTTFTVQFSPSSVGSETGAVTIGNNSEASPYTFSITAEAEADTDPPTLGAISPAASTWTRSGANLTISVDIVDTGSGVDDSTVLANLSALGLGSAEPYDLKVGDNYRWLIVVGAVTDGLKVYTIDASDNEGNPAPQADCDVRVDNSSPTDPTPSSSSHTVSAWSNDNTVDIAITGASDAGGSGVDGFEFEWNQSATWTPTQTKEQEETWSGATLTASSDGDWTFHIATVDNVGNWTSTRHLGPFRIDTTPPSVPTGLDPSSGSYTNDTSPILSWSASTDPGGSGIRTTDAYRIVVTGPVNRDTYVSDTDYNPTLAEGTFTWKIYARDNAGNASSYTADVTLHIDATQPDVTITQAGGQSDPTNSSPVTFTVVFNEPIDDATFTDADVSVGGTAVTGAVTVTEVAPNDDTTFEVSIAVTGDGTVVPTIPAGGVEDYAGNANTASTSTDNSVTYDGSKPSVTIDQDAGQVDPTNSSPVLFTVVFDEMIEQATFAGADVSVGGTATTGAPTIIEIAPNDGTRFLVSIVVTVDGTVIPTIPAGGVEDPFGNTNHASTSTDNSVTVDTDEPTLDAVTASPTLIADANVGDKGFSLTFDYSESMNPGVAPSISFPAENPLGSITFDSGSWTDADTYVAYYDIADAGVEIAAVDVRVSGAKDLAGNTQVVCDESDAFDIDTLNPTPTIWFGDTLITDADVGSVYYLSMSFSEDMDTARGWPTWSFSPNVTTTGDGTGTLSHGTPAGWTSSTTFRRIYAVLDANDPYKTVDLHLNTAYDLAGNLIEPSPTINAGALVVDTGNPTVASIAVSDIWLDELDDGETFTVTVDFAEAMTTDRSADPTITFTPDVATTLTISTEAWIDGDTWEVTYEVSDSDVIAPDVGIGVTGGRDAVGNDQVPYDDPDRFDIDMVTPPPGTPPSIVVVPAGEPGDGSFLDRCILLEEGEDPPIIMGRRLEAIYTIGEPITGGCMLTDADGEPLCSLLVIAELYRLDFDGFPPEYDRVYSEFVRHSATSGCYAYWIPTEELAAGYYDVRLAFPDSTHVRLRIQLVTPET